MFFVYREICRFSVNGRRRRKYDIADFQIGQRVEEIDRSVEVAGGVLLGFDHRLPRAFERCQMHRRVEIAGVFYRLAQPDRVLEIAVSESVALVQIDAQTAVKIVNDVDLMSRIFKGQTDVTTDIPGTADDENAHQ